MASMWDVCAVFIAISILSHEPIHPEHVEFIANKHIHLKHAQSLPNTSNPPRTRSFQTHRIHPASQIHPKHFESIPLVKSIPNTSNPSQAHRIHPKHFECITQVESIPIPNKHAQLKHVESMPHTSLSRLFNTNFIWWLFFKDLLRWSLRQNIFLANLNSSFRPTGSVGLSILYH